MIMNNEQMYLNIDGITADALIGCYSYERGMLQPVEVSLKLYISKPDYADGIESTVDYSEVCDYVKSVIAANHFHLVENLAKQLAHQLLLNYPLLNKVEITVSKPLVNGVKAKHISCHFTQKRKFKVALALGSNMNNPRQQLINAIELLGEFIDDIKIASFYRSKPQGYSKQEDFYNTCISGYTSCTPQELLINTKKVEKLLGKKEEFINGPRIIDIDIALYESKIYNNLFLAIPHPRMYERDFVITPLAEIEPDWLHPKLNISIKEIKNSLANSENFIIEQIS
jgi:dihydroneopterin aldolase/2-amino-4-hydroxy-6-hydroxymethyldihydropteridine diphosphokinase